MVSGSTLCYFLQLITALFHLCRHILLPCNPFVFPSPLRCLYPENFKSCPFRPGLISQGALSEHSVADKSPLRPAHEHKQREEQSAELNNFMRWVRQMKKQAWGLLCRLPAPLAQHLKRFPFFVVFCLFPRTEYSYTCASLCSSEASKAS